MGDVKKALSRVWAVRALAGVVVLLRGLLLVPWDRYKSVCDLCWVYRVARIRHLSAIAYRSVMGFVSKETADGTSKLVTAFFESGAAAACKTRFLGPSSDLETMFRDFIVLKPSTDDEKGVLVLEYSQKFDLFIALFDLAQMMKDYYIVLEPCWAGYCDPSILMFTSSNNNVVVQCPEKSDFDFIAGLNSNLVPIALGSSDWIDPDLFAPPTSRERTIFDLVMVANWARHKNHKKLFEALEKIDRRPISLLLIGVAWGGRTEADVLSEMAQFRLPHMSLTIKSNLSAQEVARHLAASKVFLLLSEKEGSNRAIVEAMFSDVPAVLYENFIGGAKNKINEQTGILTSFDDLPSRIQYMLDNHHRFAPRSWALENTGSRNSTRKLNDLLRTVAQARGDRWSFDIVEKVNNPNFSYKDKGAIPHEQQARSSALRYLR